MSTDEAWLAKASRLLRREAGLRQADLPSSRYVTQQIEAGRAGQLKVDQVVAHFAAMGLKAQITVRWNGAALDRLMDVGHAQVVNGAALILPRYGFQVVTEHAFNENGERGSIDIFADHDAARAVFVGEAKSEWGSLEETLRRQDLKARLAPKLAAQAFGWGPLSIASVLVFPDGSTAQRVAARYGAALSGYPARAREIRAWLRDPAGPLGGIWLLSSAGLGRRGE